MTGNLRPLAKAGKLTNLCLPDVQWAASLALADALETLNASQAVAAKRFGIAPNTVSRWLCGATPVDLLVLELWPELATLFHARFGVRKREILLQAQERAA